MVPTGLGGAMEAHGPLYQHHHIWCQAHCPPFPVPATRGGSRNIKGGVKVAKVFDMRRNVGTFGGSGGPPPEKF